MSFQIHCDNCDESVGRFGTGVGSGVSRDLAQGVVQVQIGGGDPMFREHRFTDSYFCDWLCLAKWAKRKASDE